MGSQGRWLYKPLAAIMTLEVLLARVGHLVVLPGTRGGKSLLTIIASVIPGLFMNGTNMLIKTRRTIADFGAFLTGPGLFQSMEVNVESQLILCCLFKATIGAAIVLNTLMAHHVYLELLFGIESQSAVLHFAGIGQHHLIVMCEPMLIKGGCVLKHPAAEFAYVCFYRFAYIMSLAQVVLERSLVPVHPVAALLHANKPSALLRVPQLVLPQAFVAVERLAASRFRAVVQHMSLVLFLVQEQASFILKFIAADIALESELRIFLKSKGTIK